MAGPKPQGVVVKELKERLRGESIDEILRKEREMREQLFRLKFQHASGQTEVLEKMRQLRKDIARAQTIAAERAREGKS